MFLWYNRFMVKKPWNGSTAQTKDSSTKKTDEDRSQSSDQKSRRPMPGVLRILLSIIILALISVVLAWYFCWQTNGQAADLTDQFIQTKGDLFWYNVVIIFFLVAVLAAILWRPFLSIGIWFSILSILAYINDQKMLARNAPLLPEDFQMVDAMGAMTNFVDAGEVTRLVFGIILVLVGTGLLDFWLKRILGQRAMGRERRKRLPWWERIMLMPRVALGAVACAGLVVVASPVINQSESEFLPTLDFVAWNQTENIETNGFLIGFLYNLGQHEVQMPDDYSAERIAEISKKYRTEKVADTERQPLDEVAKNVVVILDETFYDPELLSKYYTHAGDDVIPNLRKIFEKYPSGYMYSPEYGGGTANVEFEVLSGLSNFWAQNYPYVNYLSKGDGILATPAWAKEFGFNTTAIHSYDRAIYKRNFAYPRLGYDQFLDAEQFKYTEREYESTYINDRSIFREILDILQDGDEPHFVGAVTMQNHTPYVGPNYPQLDFLVDDNRDLSMNLQSLHMADQYVAEFLEALDQLSEPTVVLWFGDHTAGLFNEYINSEQKSEQNLVHLTPYFIYANFEIESPYTVDEVAAENAVLGIEVDQPNADLPTTTPNCLANQMYNILNAEKPILGYLLDRVCTETPILAASYYGADDPAETTALKEYELVNYDILNGERYWTGL